MSWAAKVTRPCCTDAPRRPQGPQLHLLLRRRLLGAATLATATLWAGSASAGPGATSVATIDYTRDWIVQPTVARALIDAGALVIDARGNDWHRWRGELVHAASASWQDLSQPELRVRGMLLEDDVVVTRKLQALGVSRDRSIVVVGDPLSGWGEDGRIAWTLRTLGHPKVVMVDGGLPALRKLGELRILPPRIPGDFVVNRTPQWDVRKEEVKARIARPDTVILDVREQREYDGKTPYGESRGGHIPGAKSLWFKELIGKDGVLLARAQIESLLAANGITRDTEVIAYCSGGIRSAWFTALLNDMGYKGRNYSGSMWEWSAMPATEYPLVR